MTDCMVSLSLFSRDTHMIPAYKKASQCQKCGELFHTAIECKNSGRLCCYCGKPEHENTVQIVKIKESEEEIIFTAHS